MVVVLLDMIRRNQWEYSVQNVSWIIWKIRRMWGGKIFDRWLLILDKVLDKIKNIIGIEKFHDTKILIYTDDILVDDIALKNVVMLIICVMKDGDKFYPHLEEALYDE